MCNVDLTVAHMLELDIFRRAKAEIIAGRQAADNPVRWVHISEMPDVARYLKGGELLFTTGMGLGHNAALHRRYIKALADVPIAGLVVRLGTTFRDLPQSLAEEADLRGLPLIVLRRRIGAIELTEQVHKEIVSRQFELIAKAEAIGHEFTNLVMRTVDLESLLHHLARTVQNPVVLEDQAHQVIAYDAHMATVEQVLGSWEDHSRRSHRDTEVGVHTADGATPCAWTAISAHGEAWGRLHILAVLKPIDDIDCLALDRAMAAITMTLLRDSDLRRHKERAVRALIADILENRQGQADEFNRRAAVCRAELVGKTLIALVLVPRGLRALVAREELDQGRHHEIRERVLDETRRAIAENGAAELCGLDGDRVLAVVGLPSGDNVRLAAERIGVAACTRVVECAGPLHPVVGVSGPTTPDALGRSLEEAGEAAAFGRATQGGPTVFHFSDLGVQHLLLRLAEGPELARFVESELGVLLIHDIETAFPLLPTLRAFLAYGGQKNAAARFLSIERRTLYHRLHRIERALGRSIDNQEARFRLALALRGLDFLTNHSPLDSDVMKASSTLTARGRGRVS
jgi:PucR family transcriptional regulator, purine catabolism regulatory protein